MKQTLWNYQEADYFRRILYALKSAWMLEGAVLILFLLRIYMAAFPLLGMLILGLIIQFIRIYTYVYFIEIDESSLTIKYYKGNTIISTKVSIDAFRVEYAFGGTGLYAFWAPANFTCYEGSKVLVRQVEGPKGFKSNNDLKFFIASLSDRQINTVNNWRN